MATYHRFRILLRAPLEPAFRDESGWWDFRSRINAADETTLEPATSASAPSRAAWKSPLRAAPCRKFVLVHGERRIGGAASLLKDIMSRRLSLWLPHLSAALLPHELKLILPAPGIEDGPRRRCIEGVWVRAVGSWSSGGSLYEFQDKPAELVSDPDASFVLKGDADATEGAQGWTEPLVLEIDLPLPEPRRESTAQKMFWSAVLSHQNVLDVQPLSDGNVSLEIRGQFYQNAEQIVSDSQLGPQTRSAIQALVCGNRERPCARWFLVLDSLGGEFRLTGFGSGKAVWSWFAPPKGLGFWGRWLAALASERLGIAAIESSPEVRVTRVIAPSAFRDIRWDNLSTESLAEPPNVIISGQKESSRWQDRLEALADPCGIIDDQERAGELRARRLSQACLLPHASIRVQLPDWPVQSQQPATGTSARLKEDWDQLIVRGGWLDLVSSAMWPEAWWPRGMLWNGVSTADGRPWPVSGTGWHDQFYESLHEAPISYQASWRVESHFILGGSPLAGDDLLGAAPVDACIRALAIR